MPSTYEWIGVVGGILGTVGGVAGTWLSLVSLRRTNQYKALDLRVQLRKEEATIKSDHAALSELMDYEKRSRVAVLSAAGMFRSSVHDDWMKKFEGAVASREGIRAEVDGLGGDVSTLSPSQLEQRTIRAHELKRTVDDLANRSRENIEEDDRRRDRLSNTRHPGS